MLKKIPNNPIPEELINALITLNDKGEFKKILLRFPHLSKLYPNNSKLFNIMGVIFADNNCKLKAIECFRKAIKFDLNNPHPYNNLGISLIDINEFVEAKKILNKAITLFPEFMETYFNLGNLYKINKEYQKAIKIFKKCIILNPNSLETYKNLFWIFKKINAPKELDHLINEATNRIKYLSNKNAVIWKKWMAMSLHEIAEAHENKHSLIEAKKKYYRAIQIKKDYTPSLNNLSNLLFKEGNKEKALKYLKISRKIQPNNITFLNNIAVIYMQKKNYYLAIKYLTKALTKEKTALNLLTNLTMCDINLFNNKRANQNLKILKNQLFETESLSTDKLFYLKQILFYITYLNHLSDKEIFEFHQLYGKYHDNMKEVSWKPFTPIKKPKKKLKIGYVSPDFNAHSMKGFLKPVLANHNHEHFEIYAFAELSKEDQVTKQYQSYVDHWIPTQNLTDQQMAQKIRDMEIDILVDLAGHTENNRLLVFARKPAPVSVTWLGYGYTTGLTAIDYFLTDKVMVPTGSEHLFSEQPWRLNNYGHCCYQAKTDMGEVGPLPALKNGHITFGTLTRAIRINDRVIKVWANILKRVKHSKLIINSEDFKKLEMLNHLEDKFNILGISNEQLFFCFKSPPWDTTRQIDIALDCFPHNSGTTLIEHLYMGNPFITYSNRPSVGRIGASILTALGREEWIANSEQEYVDKVVALAKNTEKLSTIRNSLRKEMQASPIMDHKGFVRELEKTYQSMWKDYVTKR